MGVVLVARPGVVNATDVIKSHPKRGDEEQRLFWIVLYLDFTEDQEGSCVVNSP